MTEKSSKTIRAAGGIISGVGRNKGKIAVVHRQRYGGEVGLPKGKLNEGETEVVAALREVEEETGLRPIFRQLIGSTHYIVDHQQKTVTYFLMDAPDDTPASPHDSKEVQAVEWLTPDEAIAALTHDEDRKLVTKVFVNEKQESSANTLQGWFSDSPERRRLEAAIEDAGITLEQYRHEAQKEDWWSIANQHHKQAKQHLDTGNLHQGWASLQSAHRTLLLNPRVPGGLQLVAIQLRHELNKVSGWRRKTIKDLICDKKGKLRTDIFSGPSRMRVIYALSLRDDQFQTNYFKILLRRRSLFWLFFLLLAGIATSLLLSGLDVLPHPFNQVGINGQCSIVRHTGCGTERGPAVFLGRIFQQKYPPQQIGSGRDLDAAGYRCSGGIDLLCISKCEGD